MPNMIQTIAQSRGFHLLSRHLLLLCCVVLMFGGLWLGFWQVALLGLALVALGIYDRLQTQHAVLRNYPIAGHFRYLFENFRPEIRQYFMEGDRDEVPFSREQRALVYQRAKGASDTRAFGTLSNLYENGSEWMVQSIRPIELKQHDFRITIGGEQCSQPYHASIFNISAMSFGALSANAIRALNRGAELGGFYHDTGEGSVSQYHLESQGDLVWEIGSGYYGCRTPDGNFNPEKFAAKAVHPQVKMIEIKISQGAKPGLGGQLPANKISREIAIARDVPMGQDCISPAAHRAFSTPAELLAFIRQLRELSGGKPVGFKLCIGQPWEFMAIVKAMLAENSYPDFIVIDGAEGGTGAAASEFMDTMGMPLRDGLLLVHNTLMGVGLRHKIRLGVSGKIITAFDIARMLALGADWCNSARGFMFALGCIQSRICNTDKCPTGVATQDGFRQQALVVGDKSQRVYHFHANTLKALAELIGAAGLTHPEQLEPFHVVRREPDGQVRLLSKHYFYMDQGALLRGDCPSEVYNQLWQMASAAHFAPKQAENLRHNSPEVST